MSSNIFGRLIERFLPHSVFCPICGMTKRVFLPLPNYYFENANKNGYRYFGQGEMTALETYSCSVCGASDRERLYAFWLNRKMKIKSTVRPRMIHFAPEEALSRWIQTINYFEYETADLFRDDVTHKVDITKMPFDDEQYDCFVCSHVLEHVADDAAAMKELHRILKPGGYGILVAPVIVGLEHIIEDSSITSDEDRWKFFGQHDHVRLYSHEDYVARIQESGFIIRELGERYFGRNVFRNLGLKPTSILYIVERLQA